MTAVDLLNRRLGEGLGFALSGTLPRFSWKFSTEVFWYFREGVHENFQRQCWADRIGRVWLLCEWRLPTGFDASTGQQYPLNESHWWQMFKGAIPYPKGGSYNPYPETQLKPGELPTAERTQNYIWAIDKQMSGDYQEHLMECRDDLQQDHDTFRDNQIDEWMDAAPAFGNYDPGKRGGYLSMPYSERDRAI